MCFSVRVRGCQRYSPQQRDQRAYEKEKTNKKPPEMFGYGPTEIERRRRDPDESAIPNSHRGFERSASPDRGGL